MSVSLLSLMSSAVSIVLNLIVLIGSIVWAVSARHRLGPPAVRLLCSGIVLIMLNLIGLTLLNLTVSQWAGPAGWHVEQIIISNMISAMIHSVGLGLIIASSLVRRPADAYLPPPAAPSTGE